MEIAPVDKYELFGLTNIPEIGEHTNLAQIFTAAAQLKGGFLPGDILVVASKVISKSEGMLLSLDGIKPTQQALELSKITGKSPSVCQVVIEQAQKVWTNGTALLGLTKHGYELSSAGIDRVDENHVLLLPDDPDLSAQRLSEAIQQITGTQVGVVISDSQGRADRAGAGAVALGCYGIPPLRITSAQTPDGKIKTSDETLCDMLAAAAAIIMGQRGRGIPAVCIRGIKYGFDENAKVGNILHHRPSH
jgi:coenzyme F420-0:L-glutamate ligase/coenzyme F420-1:gamma-L-glutamate ligase